MQNLSLLLHSDTLCHCLKTLTLRCGQCCSVSRCHSLEKGAGTIILVIILAEYKDTPSSVNWYFLIWFHFHINAWDIKSTGQNVSEYWRKCISQNKQISDSKVAWVTYICGLSLDFWTAQLWAAFYWNCLNECRHCEIIKYLIWVLYVFISLLPMLVRFLTKQL